MSYLNNKILNPGFLFILLLFFSCQENERLYTEQKISGFSLIRDFPNLTAEMTELDTIRVWANLSLCLNEGIELLTITKKGDSVKIQPEYSETSHLESEFKILKPVVIASDNRTWKFNDFLIKNEELMYLSDKRRGSIVVWINEEKIVLKTNGLSESSRLLADYCISMKNIMPESEHHIFAPEIIND